MPLHLLGIGRELDAARLPAPADQHLRLHHHGVADAFRHLDGVGDGVDRRAVRHRDAVAREQLLALIFEEIHPG